MITCNIKGGIGNQLFQVAFAYATGKETNRECILLDNQFAGASQGRHVSVYYDTIFRKIKRCTPYFAERFVIEEKHWSYYEIQEQIKAAVLPANSVLIADGYFQSPKYFEKYMNELKQLFWPDNGVINFLRSSEIYAKYPELFGSEMKSYCYMGVRRGDYLKAAHIHNPCERDYYINAMKHVPAKRYYIASDDIEWCKEMFKGDEYIYFDIEDDMLQLYTGMLFKNYIISNSSYHWWASELSINEEIKIVAPEEWIRLEGEDARSIYASNMTVIERA